MSPSVQLYAFGIEPPPACVVARDFVAGLDLRGCVATCVAVVDRCTCASGCASCTQAGRFGARDAQDAKAESAIVLRGLLSSWAAADDDAAPGGSA